MTTFVDRARVRVVAGTGGSGACSFARFKFRPKGGPDGGDGGRGGSIYVQADPNLSTLLDYRYHSEWKADRGAHGKGKNQTGASGSDVYLPVPPGTVVTEAETGRVLGELLRGGDTFLVAKGGRGGRGNTRFATSTHQAPREWEPGESGEEREIELVLKLIADVGLVGEPNAGKSTLLSVLSAARPKIADYPFTTLEPNLGVVPMGDHRSFVMADVPGIIEGAHKGKGLGLRFLQHVERTRVLAFLVPLDAEDHQAVLDRLRAEIAQYSTALSRKPYLVVLSKRDLWPADSSLPSISAQDALGVVAISGAARTGLDQLKQVLWKAVEQARLEEPEVMEPGEVAVDEEEELEW
ncbi:MAG TPA: GTPase ObgE [Gemmatimonadales bacterium]|jgi:GTP-binding protein|nr:GTPase ObgE [Gemmatimonadales bacterium]